MALSKTRRSYYPEVCEVTYNPRLQQFEVVMGIKGLLLSRPITRTPHVPGALGNENLHRFLERMCGPLPGAQDALRTVYRAKASFAPKPNTATLTYVARLVFEPGPQGKFMANIDRRDPELLAHILSAIEMETPSAA